MSEKDEGEFLSKLERRYFDALASYATIREAADALGVKPQTLYNWVHNLRLRYKKRRGWVNAVVSQKRRSELIRRVLSERKPLEGLGEESLEEEH
ncbi:MAG: helix-turn-helix domain-containing protein [Candidatus Bathycorpusculaceae bacterium]